MTTQILSKTTNTKSSTKIIAITVSTATHEKFKKLAKFQGLNIGSAGLEAIEDWITYVIENNVKPTIKELKEQAKLGSEIIKG